jgi:hypothetical protein
LINGSQCDVIISVKTEGLIHIPKPILRERRPIHHTIIPIPTLIIRIAIKRPPAHEAVGGNVGWKLGVKGGAQHQAEKGSQDRFHTMGFVFLKGRAKILYVDG